ncbi:hypothetical protein GQR58_008417 [Nymphon striatum]|nr:hypothetical protein GQR58_008417 [Nymphon striatum]
MVVKFYFSHQNWDVSQVLHITGAWCGLGLDGLVKQMDSYNLDPSSQESQSISTLRNRDSLGSDRTSSGSDTSSNDNVDNSNRREQDTGNVLHDIDNMLADLNDELNAMLENEPVQ